MPCFISRRIYVDLFVGPDYCLWVSGGKDKVKGV